MRDKSKKRAAPGARNTRDGKEITLQNDFVPNYTVQKAELSSVKPNLLRVADKKPNLAKLFDFIRKQDRPGQFAALLFVIAAGLLDNDGGEP